jgi:hypothetical protein
MKENQAATVKPGEGARSGVVRTPHREASMIMTARTRWQGRA